MEGLVTLEDVAEEVFGELHDTLEAEQPSIQQTPEGRVLLRGEVRLREVHQYVGWDLQEEDVETIAGYIMKHLGRTARVGDTIDTPYGTTRVENMARVRIMQVAHSAHPPDRHRGIRRLSFAVPLLLNVRGL